MLRTALLAITCLVTACGFDAPQGSEGTGDAPPLDAPPTEGWLAVATGADHSCGIRVGGALWCWGDNQFGELGQGSGAALATPESSIPMRVGTSAWKAISVGRYTSCGIQSDDSLWCWGYNAESRAGVDAADPQLAEPRKIGEAMWSTISVGWAHGCGITTGGELMCWGTNTSGQLGIGTTSDHELPTLVPGSWLEVSAGYDSTCGVRADHVIACWGANSAGQLGTGTTTPSATPVPVFAGTSTVGYDRVELSFQTTCALRTDGHVRCWGANGTGAVGDGGPQDRLVPTAPVPDMGDLRDIAVGGTQACALRADGALVCWGQSAHGELGDATLGTDKIGIPQVVGAMQGPWRALAHHLGYWSTCAITTAGAIECTGYDARGGLGAGTGGSRRTPTRVDGVYTSVSIGSTTTCARRTDGGLTCWGNNDYGQYGIGDTIMREVPYVLTGREGDEIVSGYYFTCDVRANHDVYCAGYNADHQVAGMDVIAHSMPMKIPGVSSAVITVKTHACTIPVGSGGGVFCWGRNSSGQLGVGDTAVHLAPVRAGEPTKMDAVGAGNEHQCAVTAGHDLGCVGDNSHGQLGDGTTISRTLGAAVRGGAMWDDVEGGATHTCGRTTTGALWCWGGNFAGQVGTGDTTDQLAPVAITGGTWKKFALGLDHTCGIHTDGSLWCWGLNLRGQVGNDSFVNAATPQPIGPTGVAWTEVAAGDYSTCAIQDDGSLWCWGTNAFGQVGDGTAWRSTWQPVKMLE